MLHQRYVEDNKQISSGDINHNNFFVYGSD